MLDRKREEKSTENITLARKVITLGIIHKVQQEPFTALSQRCVAVWKVRLRIRKSQKCWCASLLGISRRDECKPTVRHSQPCTDSSSGRTRLPRSQRTNHKPQTTRNMHWTWLGNSLCLCRHLPCTDVTFDSIHANLHSSRIAAACRHWMTRTALLLKVTGECVSTTHTTHS